MTLAIPASQLVGSTPGVISAGGAQLETLGLLLTYNTRTPIGTVLSFSSAAAVASYYGATSVEANLASIYFSGYTNCTIYPAAMLIAQYPWQSAVSAYLRGGSGLTLAQVQAITAGVLTLTIDGASVTSSAFNLSAVTSFSAAATAIQTALASQDASFTGVLTPAVGVTANTSTISGTTLTVVTMASGSIVPGAVLTGSTVVAGTTVVAQLTGTPGGAGTYSVSASQTVSATAITATNAAQSLLTASSVTGTLAAGQSLNGVGVTAGSKIVSQLSGTAGGAGTYICTPSQTVSSEAMTGGLVTVTYDSVSGAFVISSGSTGTGSTIGYATGSASATLLLTAATGAVLSQGAPIATPVAFMNSIIAQTQNFVDFWTAFQPVVTDIVSFAQWTNSQNNRYAYIEWDTNAAETTATDTSSPGYLIRQANYSGTMLNYAPVNGASIAAFISGTIASLNINATNGRATLAYRNQAGLMGDVTSGVVSANLLANGYNFYGSYSTANQNFTLMQNGSITGEFLWTDSYINQIWMNAFFQVNLLTLLATVGVVPYNAAGYALIAQAMQPTISTALAYGAIQSGVTLSALQIAEVNNAAGLNIAATVQSRGWYLLIADPGATVRAARGTPIIKFFYTDGQSVQVINVNTVEVD